MQRRAAAPKPCPVGDSETTLAFETCPLLPITTRTATTATSSCAASGKRPRQGSLTRRRGFWLRSETAVRPSPGGGVRTGALPVPPTRAPASPCVAVPPTATTPLPYTWLFGS